MILQGVVLFSNLHATFRVLLLPSGILIPRFGLPDKGDGQGGTRGCLDELIELVRSAGFQMSFERRLSRSSTTGWKGKRSLAQLTNALEREVDSVVSGDLGPHLLPFGVG